MLRDRLLARIAEMGDAVDHQRLAAEVLGIRGAPPALARRLVAQALVVEDRQAGWQRHGERICREAPAGPAVYILKDEEGRALYVGKAIDLPRRLRAHFARRRWRSMPPELSRVVDAEWVRVGSDLEALLREAMLIDELRPIVNVQVAAPELSTRDLPSALVRDVLVVVPSVEDDSAEIIAARVDGPCLIQRTRRNGADLAVHSTRLVKFFRRSRSPIRNPQSPIRNDRVRSPLVFSWLAGRGAAASRLDPSDSMTANVLERKLRALLRDERLFHERLEQC
jgi:predicted GIY-YIG superfamily endonuclease